MVRPGVDGYETEAIGAPPPDSGVAWSINNAGLIVGMSAPVSSLHTAVIFTLDSKVPLIDLGVLPHASSSVAYDVNDSGVIVGSSGDHPEWVSGHALAIIDGNLHDLNDLADDAEGEWDVLVEATAIDNHNRIVGWGETLDGKISAFLLLPDLEGSFIRGDCNADGALDLSDAIQSLFYQFMGVSINCLDAADVDDDGEAEIADVISLMTYLFLEGPRPESPFPACGPDGNGDDFPPCEYPAESCNYN
jgi:hypothetical protein